MAKIGYMRTSTEDQTGLAQREALEDAGCEKIYYDKGVSGAAALRPQFDAALAAVSPGDELVIWRLDRLGRSLRFILEDFERIGAAGAHVIFLKERIDTTTPGGRLYFHMTGAFAEFERELIRERTVAGMEAAKAAGKPVGRPPSITDEMWADMAPRLQEKDANVARIARTYGVTRYAIIRRMKAAEL